MVNKFMQNNLVYCLSISESEPRPGRPKVLLLGGWLLESVFPPNLPVSEEPREQRTVLNEVP